MNHVERFRAVMDFQPADRQRRGDAVVWITLEGYFWFPRTLMGFTKISLVGHFDKMVMDKGEQAMRNEFERLLPLMRSGGFIPSVDHQTPPHVTIDQYRSFRRLLDEFTAAVSQESVLH